MHYQHGHPNVEAMGLDAVLVQRDAPLVPVVNALDPVVVEPHGDAEVKILTAPEDSEIPIDEPAAHGVGAARVVERREALADEKAAAAGGHSAQVAKDRLRCAEV